MISMHYFRFVSRLVWLKTFSTYCYFRKDSSKNKEDQHHGWRWIHHFGGVDSLIGAREKENYNVKQNFPPYEWHFENKLSITEKWYTIIDRFDHSISKIRMQKKGLKLVSDERRISWKSSWVQLKMNTVRLEHNQSIESILIAWSSKGLIERDLTRTAFRCNNTLSTYFAPFVNVFQDSMLTQNRHHYVSSCW